MKDLPHHIKKLNRRVIRSALREGEEERIQEPGLPRFHVSQEEARKLEKRKIREARLSRTPIHDTIDERNRKMKYRVPIFDRNNAKPRIAKPTKKKTPRI